MLKKSGAERPPVAALGTKGSCKGILMPLLEVYYRT